MYIIVIIIVVCLFSYNFFDFIYDKFSVKNTTQIDTNDIYNLLQIVSCNFEQNNVEYIITGGTLLGAVRHRGLIPHDDDADVAVLNKTPSEILIMLEELNKQYNNELVFYEHIKGNIIVVKTKTSRVSIDIFFMNESKNLFDDNLSYKYLFPFNIQYPNEWFIKSELYPLKNYEFGPLVLKGPNVYINFLNRTYPEWQTVASKWNHNSLIIVNEKTTNFIPNLPDNKFILKTCKLN